MPETTTAKTSTRFSRKGALIQETRLILSEWNESSPIQENLIRILFDNPIGARTEGWLKEIRVTLSGKLACLQDSHLSSLVQLSKSRCSPDVWQACLHWHWGIIDSLYYDYSTNWLYSQHQSGVYRMESLDAKNFVQSHLARLKRKNLSEYGLLRAARDMFRVSSEFGILTGSIHKEFAAYHLPEAGFLYILHALSMHEPSALRIMESHDWQLFLLDASDVERELLRLHQYRKVHFERAGSFLRLELPYHTATAYVNEALT